MVEKMVKEGADAVLFFSPSAIHHLQDILEMRIFRSFRSARFSRRSGR